MDSDGPTTVLTRRRFRSWVRWILVTAALLPPLAFGLSNLWLASPYGRSAIAARIQQRCGLDTRIGAASWSPWRGITLRELEIAQPTALREEIADPLLRIASMRIEPEWSELLKRRLAIRSVTADQPKLVLTVEMMSQLAQQVETPPSMPLALAQAAAPPLANTVPGPAPEASAQPVPSPAVQPPAAAPPAAPPGPAGPARWLRLRSAAFQLRSVAGGRVLLEAAGFDGDIPLAGAAAHSDLGLKTVSVWGEPILSGFRAKLSWQAPVLTLEPDPPATRIAGVEVHFAGQLALRPGLPVLLAVEVPQQTVSVPVSAFGLTAEARSALVQARFLGGLLAPGSWQGDLVANASGIAVNHAEKSFAFDRAACATVIRGGMLSCVDARLIGDDLSLLGNGTLLADGRLAAVIRLVAPAETAATAVRRLFPDLTNAPQPVPLSSPQRVSLDVALSGTFHDPLLRVGEEGPLVSLRPPPTPP